MKKNIFHFVHASKLALSFSAFILFSCTGGEKAKDVQDYPSTPLEFVNIFHPAEHEESEPFIGMPHQIAVVDSILICADEIDGMALLLYNLNNGSYRRVLRMGPGPDDIQSTPLDISVSHSDKRIIILQRRTGELRSYYLQDLWNDSIKTPRRLKDKFGGDRASCTSEGYVLSGHYQDGILHFYKESGEMTDSIDLHPEWPQDPIGKYRLLQGHIAFNESSGYVMYAPIFASDFLCFGLENDHWKEVSSFTLGDKRIEQRGMEGNWELKKDDIHRSIDACASDQYFYILYEGRAFSVTQEGRVGEELVKGNHIYVIRFTAKGELDTVYEVDPTILNICVTADDSCLYAILRGKDGEYTVGKALLK